VICIAPYYVEAPLLRRTDMARVYNGDHTVLPGEKKGGRRRGGEGKKSKNTSSVNSCLRPSDDGDDDDDDHDISKRIFYSQETSV